MSKKNQQKPAEQKPEDLKDAVEVVEATETPVADEQIPDEPEDLKDEAETPDEAEAPEAKPIIESKALTVGEIKVKIGVEFSGNLSARVGKAALAAGQDNPRHAQSLSRLELILADLKNALPAAINDAAAGDPLAADLSGMLALL